MSCIRDQIFRAVKADAVAGAQFLAAHRAGLAVDLDLAVLDEVFRHTAGAGSVGQLQKTLQLDKFRRDRDGDPFGGNAPYSNFHLGSSFRGLFGKCGGNFMCRHAERSRAFPTGEEDGRLHDPVLRENFVERVFALHELNHLYKEKLSRRELLAFHSRYKLQLLAHSQAGYKDMGPFLAAIHEWADLESYFEVYRDKLMAILRKPASRKNHTNVLMHIQGYFSNYLSTRQRKELSEVILNYRSGTLPLLAPLTLLKHYLGEYPNDYLLTQNYFDPYPDELALRLMVN